MICDKCGAELEVGSWPFCGDRKNVHGKPSPSKGFLAYFDDGLGKSVTGWGDINKECRPRWEGGKLIHLQPRDKPEKYYKELIEKRRDRDAKR